jgi:hypothetical protein
VWSGIEFDVQGAPQRDTDGGAVGCGFGGHWRAPYSGRAR